MKTYLINEIFYSLQGEGIRAGVPSAFIRFAGCNLRCRQEQQGFDCDTQADEGEHMTATEILMRTKALGRRCRWVVLTGGEPGLQIDHDLVQIFVNSGYKIAIESNGTIPLPGGIDWITLSPKKESLISQHRADELKFVIRDGDPIPKIPDIRCPNLILSPAFEVLTSPLTGDLTHWLQADNLKHCIDLCLTNPEWRLSEQRHKLWGVR